MRVDHNRGIFRIAAAVAVVVLSLVPVQGQEKIYDEHQSGITPPRPTKRVSPQYDASAKAEKIEGPVKLIVVISKEGKPVSVSVAEGLDRRLDRQAVAAARQWEFAPARLNGAPVAFRLALHLNFRVEGDAPAAR